MTPATEDGRVTLAIISEQVKNLDRKISESILGELHDHEGRLRAVEARSASNEQRLGVYATGQAVFTMIAAAIAGFVGSR